MVSRNVSLRYYRQKQFIKIPLTEISKCKTSFDITKQQKYINLNKKPNNEYLRLQSQCI